MSIYESDSSKYLASKITGAHLAISLKNGADSSMRRLFFPSSHAGWGLSSRMAWGSTFSFGIWRFVGVLPAIT